MKNLRKQDTILCDEEFNTLYREHAQKKLIKI